MNYQAFQRTLTKNNATLLSEYKYYLNLKITSIIGIPFMLLILSLMIYRMLNPIK